MGRLFAAQARAVGCGGGLRVTAYDRHGWKADIGALAAMVVCGPAAMWRWTRRSRLLFALLAPEHDVRCEVCSGGSHHAVAKRREIQPLEHRFAPTEQDR